jgi:hypothetical protein
MTSKKLKDTYKSPFSQSDFVIFWVLVPWPRRLGKTAIKIRRVEGRDPKAHNKTK